jgi:oligopeptide/dipeptide ABC transporter ATP-binding protein
METGDRVLLNVENLKTYFFTRRGVAKAVDGVSFFIEKGEALGLVGESACGKTVTSLSILRLIPKPAGKIVGGRIIFEGEDLLKKSEGEMRKIRGKRISMILQDPMTSLNPAFTIGNQIGEALILHQHVKGKTLWQRVIESLRLVKIPSAETRARDYPHQMSGGMRQRVTGAIALSCQPSLLIADEPTTSLDVTIQAQYLKLLKELQLQVGVSLLLITHDFGIVARMCDRVAVMYAGKIVEKAETRELFNNPRHPYTRALLGCLPKVEAKGLRLANIVGQPPDVANLPPGCNFAPRCQKRGDRCEREYPPETEVCRNHYVSCWYEY